MTYSRLNQNNNKHNREFYFPHPTSHATRMRYEALGTMYAY